MPYLQPEMEMVHKHTHLRQSTTKQVVVKSAHTLIQLLSSHLLLQQLLWTLGGRCCLLYS